MDVLQSVIAFWRDCMKSEGALEQSFAVHSSKFAMAPRMRAVVFEGTEDPFIFAAEGCSYTLSDGRAYELALHAPQRGQELYYGYPMLMFYDAKTKQNHVAPLFVMRLEAEQTENAVRLIRGEPTPTLGSHAFEKLGLKQEEIVALNTRIADIFTHNKAGKLDTILHVLRQETALALIEIIDPEHLSTNETIHAYHGVVLYNKAMLFAGEASAFNFHVLQDLECLITKPDLHETALRYILKRSETSERTTDTIPILPFAFDEDHVQAIQHILHNDHSVVTGPPGTGKSQFIANLIITLFLQHKKVLFVSHTGEAVRVVNERINNQFAHLIMQTGKKEIRQELGQRLAELVARYNNQEIPDGTGYASMGDIANNWHAMIQQTQALRSRNRLHSKLERLLHAQEHYQHSSSYTHQLQRYMGAVRLGWAFHRLRRYGDSTQLLAAISVRKDEHVRMSHEYVQANYLRIIFDNESYGELLAYIDSIQNKRPTNPDSDISEKYIRAALGAMNVWSCTLKSLAASFPLQANLFDYVIFDEASQIDLPSAAPALYRARRLVVVGDQNQLHHIAKISLHTEEGLARRHHLIGQSLYPALVSYREASLFNSAKKALSHPEQELRNHYRSHASIAHLFSSVFYNNRLTIHEPEITLPASIEPGVRWRDVAGTAHTHRSGSRYNVEEVRAIGRLMQQLLPLALKYGITIGITTTYAKQREMIADSLSRQFSAAELTPVRILTVHQFQGSEVDILIFSPVVATHGEGGSDAWYVHNAQLLNVAISRAKQALYIVGDKAFALQSESKLREIAQYCEHAHDEARPYSSLRPMNIFEKRLLNLLKRAVPKTMQIEPQYVVGGRFTLDFALLGGNRKIAIELDGRQHEIIGGLPVLDDGKRDAYLYGTGWSIVRISVYELFQAPEKVVASISRDLM